MWSDEAYQETYRQAGLHVLATLRPLAKEDEPYEWVNETRIAPWVIYVLQRAEKRCRGKRSKSFIDGSALDAHAITRASVSTRLGVKLASRGGLRIMSRGCTAVKVGPFDPSIQEES